MAVDFFLLGFLAACALPRCSLSEEEQVAAEEAEEAEVPEMLLGVHDLCALRERLAVLVDLLALPLVSLWVLRFAELAEATLASLGERSSSRSCSRSCCSCCCPGSSDSEAPLLGVRDLRGRSVGPTFSELLRKSLLGQGHLARELELLLLELPTVLLVGDSALLGAAGGLLARFSTED